MVFPVMACLGNGLEWPEVSCLLGAQARGRDRRRGGGKQCRGPREGCLASSGGREACEEGLKKRRGLDQGGGLGRHSG